MTRKFPGRGTLPGELHPADREALFALQDIPPPGRDAAAGKFFFIYESLFKGHGGAEARLLLAKPLGLGDFEVRFVEAIVPEEEAQTLAFFAERGGFHARDAGPAGEGKRRVVIAGIYG